LPASNDRHCVRRGIIELIGERNIVTRLADVQRRLEAPTPPSPDAR